MNTLEKIKNMKAEYKALVQQEGKTLVKELLTNFFANNENVKSVRWAQYTPYFNDGDACLFSVHELHINFLEGKTPKTKYESDYSDNFYSRYSLEETPTKTNLKELENTLSEIEDILEEVFGDHVRVTASRESIEIDDYDHD